MSFDLQRRMRQYLIFRLLINVLGFLLVTFYATCLPSAMKEITSVYLYSLLSVHLATAVGALVSFSRWRIHWSIFRLQVLVDFVILALLVWSTGGVLSIFSPVLFVTLAAATGVHSARGAFALATLVTVVLGGSTLLYALGVIPATSSWTAAVFTGERSTFLVSYLVASILALYAISTLGSKLSYGLRNVEHLQEKVIENMAEGLVAVAGDGRVIHLNSEARKLLGLDGRAGDYLGASLRTLFDDTPGRRDEAEWGEFCEAVLTSSKRRFEMALTGSADIRRPVEVKVSSVVDDKGKCRCRIALLSDLTLKREVEAAERRIQKLEELQVMAVGIAHEIRNPLASIRGCVQEIARMVQDEGTLRRFSNIVVRESDRVDGIIEEFLRYARCGPLDLKPLDLVEVIEQAVVMLRSRPEACSRSLLWEPPRECPRVYGDRDRLLQVFLNLGINALQATGEGDGILKIEVARRPMARLEDSGGGERGAPREGVEIRFSDNGQGVSQENLGKVFAPFFTTKADGSGLGLSIVERFVRGHNGFVDMESVPAQGTTVSIRLPLLGDGAKRDDRSSMDEWSPQHPGPMVTDDSATCRDGSREPRVTVCHA